MNQKKKKKNEEAIYDRNYGRRKLGDATDWRGFCFGVISFIFIYLSNRNKNMTYYTWKFSAYSDSIGAHAGFSGGQFH